MTGWTRTSGYSPSILYTWSVPPTCFSAAWLIHGNRATGRGISSPKRSTLTLEPMERSDGRPTCRSSQPVKTRASTAKATVTACSMDPESKQVGSKRIARLSLQELTGRPFPATTTFRHLAGKRLAEFFPGSGEQTSPWSNLA
jgi:hypothetical protein